MDRYKALLESLTVLQLNEVEARTYFQLLDFINAPNDLRYLGAVLENVIGALTQSLLTEIASNSDCVAQALKYRLEALLLLEKINARRDLEHFFRPQDTHVKRLFHNCHSEHPKYVILFMNSEHNSLFYHQFRQATLFLSELVKQQESYNSKVVLKAYEYRVLSETFRVLSDSSTVQSWYVEMQHNPCHSLVDMVRHFKLFLNTQKLRGDSSRVPGSLKRLIQVLELALGVEKKRHSGKGDRTGDSSPHRSPEIGGYSALNGNMLVRLTLPDIKDDDDLIYAVYELPDERIDYEALVSGEHINEQESGDVSIFQAAQPLKSYIQAFHGKRVSNAVLKRIVRQNNYLPLTLQMLSPAELQQLLLEMAKPPEDEVTLCEHLVLLTMLFTASTFERARSLFIANKFTDNERPMSIGYELSTNSWIIPSLELGYRTPSHIHDLEQVHLLRLAATALCKSKFQKLLQRETFSDKPKAWLNECNVQYDNIRVRLKSITTTNITPGRVSNHLLVKSCAIFGQAATALMFCQDAPGSTARSYYTSLPAALLQTRYQHLLGLSAQSVHRKQSVAAISEQSGWLGARHRPDIEQIQQTVVQMKADLEALRTQLTEPGNWVTFHNLYTTYQVFCQLILTGMRPILIPLLQTEQLIKSAGVFLRKEKARDDEFNTRHIPVCDMVVDFVSAYQSHIKIIQGRFIRLGIKPSSLPRLFFIDKTLEITEFKPSLYVRELKSYTQLPPNLNRKLLRNFFEEQGLTHEVIDVALGHANLGEEYWGAFSTLSLRDVRQQLQPKVLELARKLKIEVVPGLSA